MLIVNIRNGEKQFSNERSSDFLNSAYTDNFFEAAREKVFTRDDSGTVL